ncbi:MAG TPA: DGQHR domain-containing protein [Rhizomicrobium sp.]|jgi:DGQHR domain-containing protein|nr:DGQHR domain-containing protein [Rhizomicrobium sp.]
MASINLKEDFRSVTIPVMTVSQPIGDFFIGVIPRQIAVDISEFDIRRLVDRERFTDFLGIQREVSEKRVKDIVRYLGTTDATFPTAVILSVREECVELHSSGTQNSSMMQMRLSNYPHQDSSKRILFKQIATVIDGQHRLEALRRISREFDVNVAIFVGLDKATEAEIFSTVNLAQTKVNRSLVYDLFSYRDARSPEKTCHETAVVLDRDKRSPFHQRIKRLGVATEGRFGETLSQATFVEGLIRHISRDPIQDREIGRRGGSWSPVSQEEFERCVLRPFFVADEDEKIVSVVWNFFDAVKERWPVAWEDDGKNYVLNRSTGYLGLMRFFRDAYRHITTRPKVVSTQSFVDVLNRSKLKDADFTKDIFIPGSSGQAALAARLRADCL